MNMVCPRQFESSAAFDVLAAEKVPQDEKECLAKRTPTATLASICKGSEKFAAVPIKPIEPAIRYKPECISGRKKKRFR
jgi:hypothetical protein